MPIFDPPCAAQLAGRGEGGGRLASVVGLVLCPERCGPSPSNSMTRCSNKEESNPYHILHTSKKNESPPAPEVGSVHFQTHAVVDLVVCQCNVVFVDIIPERRYESYIWKEMDMV